MGRRCNILGSNTSCNVEFTADKYNGGGSWLINAIHNGHIYAGEYDSSQFLHNDGGEHIAVLQNIKDKNETISCKLTFMQNGKNEKCSWFNIYHTKLLGVKLI